jgi:hypothetical protein
MASDSAFRSVKLAAALVDDARAAASTMRRSVASQIEYWATLGRSLESAGLTTRDTSALIARQDAAAYAVRSTRTPDDAELESLKTHVVALAKSGALALRAREAVAANAASAVPAKGAGKARRAT